MNVADGRRPEPEPEPSRAPTNLASTHQQRGSRRMNPACLRGAKTQRFFFCLFFFSVLILFTFHFGHAQGCKYRRARRSRVPGSVCRVLEKPCTSTCLCARSHMRMLTRVQVPRDITHQPCASSCLQRDVTCGSFRVFFLRLWDMGVA